MADTYLKILSSLQIKVCLQIFDCHIGSAILGMHHMNFWNKISVFPHIET